MKRLMVVLMMIVMLSTPSFGEPSSPDTSEYVRRDVLEVHLSSINRNLEKILSEQEAQRRDIKELIKLTALLSERVDVLDARMGDLRSSIYLWLVIVILGIIVSLPVVQKMLQNREKPDRVPQPVFTLEDVERLIDAKLRERLKTE